MADQFTGACSPLPADSVEKAAASHAVGRIALSASAGDVTVIGRTAAPVPLVQSGRSRPSPTSPAQHRPRVKVSPSTPASSRPMLATNVAWRVMRSIGATQSSAAALCVSTSKPLMKRPWLKLFLRKFRSLPGLAPLSRWTAAPGGSDYLPTPRIT